MNELALFAGAGGSILTGRLLGWRCIGAVEIGAFAREVLMERQEVGDLEAFPIWDDVKTFDGTLFQGRVDVVTAGFPCQPFSVAGKRKGEKDERNLWPDTIRVISEVRPHYALLENVPGLAAKPYFWDVVLPSLAAAGFDAAWRVVSAAEVGAPHLRKRLWILAADAEREPLRVEPRRSGGQGGQEASLLGFDGDWERGQAPPLVCRVDDGMAHRVDRLRALGNGWVPQAAARAWDLLLKDLQCDSSNPSTALSVVCSGSSLSSSPGSSSQP